MTTPPFVYWKAGKEERQARLFISHRFGADQTLYDDVIDVLIRQGHKVQDLSLSAGKLISGPKGGQLSRLQVQAEIAARIYTSDLLVAPSRPAAGKSEWVAWEVRLAAAAFGVPILFVNEADLTYKSKLVSDVKELGVPCDVAERNTQSIVRKAISLIKDRPTWEMRQDEPDPSTIRFRGPPLKQREVVMKKYPFVARLKDPDHYQNNP